MTHHPTEYRDARLTSWLRATGERRSRRVFDGMPASPETIGALAETCEAFQPYDDARVVFVADPSVDAFSGVIGSYGKVVGAPHVLIVIASGRERSAQAHAGYVGEAAILEATALGLDTCWVGGFFDPKKAGRLTKLRSEERIVAISPAGFARSKIRGTEAMMRSMAGSHKRKSAEEVSPGFAGWPDWARAAAECARIAPSAMNRQPWRLRMEDGSLIVARDNGLETPRVTKALDCGIAMLHAELGAFGAGVSGSWTDARTELDVARFTPESGNG